MRQDLRETRFAVSPISGIYIYIYGNRENKKRKKKLYINCVPFRSVLDNTLFFTPSVKRLPRATPPPADPLTLNIYIIYMYILDTVTAGPRPSQCRPTPTLHPPRRFPANDEDFLPKPYRRPPRHPLTSAYIYLRFSRPGHVGSGMRVGRRRRRRRLPCSSSRRRSLMFCLALAHTSAQGETVGTTSACVFLSITGALPFKQWPLDRLQMGVCARIHADDGGAGRKHDGGGRTVHIGEGWLRYVRIYILYIYIHAECAMSIYRLRWLLQRSAARCVYIICVRARVTRDCLRISNDNNGPRAKTDRCPVGTLLKNDPSKLSPVLTPQWRPFNLPADRCQ